MQMELWILLRLATAAVLGGAIGYERERTGKSAGLRTHMLVATGAALFVSFNDLALADGRAATADASLPNLQVQIALLGPVQAIATGIGFLGAGSIVMGGRRNQVHGLTTAASIWVVAAVGAAAGFDRFLLAFGATGLVLFVLRLVVRLEPKHGDAPANAAVERRSSGPA